MQVEQYRTLVFDCDGVVLNSNPVKTQAFYDAALPYGEQAAQALVEYHKRHGGISRYQKFEYFLDQIVSSAVDGPSLDELLSTFAQRTRALLLECEIVEGLCELRSETADARWLLVSGGDQIELREVFNTRGIAKLFDGGIYGSPDSKHHILEREIQNQNIVRPAVYIGDSRYDYEASQIAQMDFIFSSQWTEFKDYSSYFGNSSVYIVSSVSELKEKGDA
ncbi:MAG: HAD family hydrolase [Pseudomonadota bacterium]